MKKILKWVGISVLAIGAMWAAVFFIKSNSKSAITYETHEPFISSIEKKTVATGKVNSSGGGGNQATNFRDHR